MSFINCFFPVKSSYKATQIQVHTKIRVTVSIYVSNHKRRVLRSGLKSAYRTICEITPCNMGYDNAEISLIFIILNVSRHFVRCMFLVEINKYKTSHSITRCYNLTAHLVIINRTFFK
jgi:hypothetical protein